MPKQNIVYRQQATGDWKLSDVDLQYEKELIYAGDFQQANGLKFTVNEMSLHHWADTFKRMNEQGIKVPVPIRHTDDPEANRGEVIAMRVSENSRGIPALYGRIKFRDKDAAQLTKTAQVSVMSPPEFVDGKGTKYVRPIRHVALTDYPVIPGLQGFESIAASFVPSNPTEGNMPLLDITKKLSIECDAEDKAEGAIVAAFEQSATTIGERDATIAERDATIKVLKQKIPADPITVTASHRSMLRDNRTMKLDKLVDTTKISPAVKDALAKEFCTDDQLNLVLSQENADDSFDRIVEALGKNEIVELAGELSGPQGGTPLDKGKVTENPLLADAKKRAEAS